MSPEPLKGTVWSCARSIRRDELGLAAKRRLEKIEADLDRRKPDRLAADGAEPLLAGDRRLPAPGAGEMDEADRLRDRPTVRPGDSGDADRDLGARVG